MLKNQCTDESLRNMVFCSVIHKTPPKTNLLGLTSQSWRCKKRSNCPRVPVSFQLGAAALSVSQCVGLCSCSALLHSIVLTLPPVERGRVGLAGQVHSDHCKQVAQDLIFIVLSDSQW